MRTYLAPLAIALCLASPAYAQSDLQKGFAGAIRGCEERVLNPASWAKGAGPFVSAVGLGDKMGLVDSVNEATLSPTELRLGNRYWRINPTQGAGYILIVSDQIPMCHITGGGDTDLQPVIEAILASTEFGKHWEKISDQSKGDMTSTQFRSRQDPSFSMVVSRANKPGERLDRVQVLATATYRSSK